jgi:hypothetical protein
MQADANGHSVRFDRNRVFREASMRRYFVTVITGSLLCFATQSAVAKTYWCDASKKDAAVGISDRAAVNVVAHRDSQECRFSVNGETVGSPPRELVINAHNVLRSDGGREIKSALDALAYALLAASPLREIPSQLRTSLQEEIGSIDKCFQALRTGEAGTYVSKAQIFCRVIARGESASVGFGNGTVRVQPTRPDSPPQLALGVLLEKSMEHYLFLPQQYAFPGALPPLQ